MNFLFKRICLLVLSVCAFVSYGNQSECKQLLSKSQIKKLETKANQGDTYAQRELGRMHLYGEGVPQNLQKSLHYWKLSEKASTQYTPRMAISQFTPLARNTNYLITLMEQSNDAEFLYYGSMLFLLGAEIVQSRSAAVEFLTKSAGMGYAKAQYALGEVYRQGFSAPQDHEKADYWFGQAKSQGYTGEHPSSSDIAEIESVLRTRVCQPWRFSSSKFRYC